MTFTPRRIEERKRDAKYLNMIKNKVRYIEQRTKLVKALLNWEKTVRSVLAIPCILSELDAANYCGLSFDEYCKQMEPKSGVDEAVDFEYKDKKYQVKANRESFKKGSKPTRTPSITMNGWDVLIYIRYNEMYEIQEAYRLEIEEFKRYHQSGTSITLTKLRERYKNNKKCNITTQMQEAITKP